jgi:DNA polymerase IV
MNDIFKEKQGLKWIFLDLNSFFASVEQNHNPYYRNRPVAVVPMMTDSTCAIAASYEAKAYGIKTGTKIYEAKKLCPQLICVLAKHDLYVEYHNRILSEVIRHIPINKVCSIDELSSCLPPNKRNRESATHVAQAIKDGLRRSVGPAISCSIGVAPNAFLAKVATDMQKPDGLVILEPETMQERLYALKLTDLPGINVAMETRLHKGGVRSVEQFMRLSPKQARAIWGSVEGERFWYQLHGVDLPSQEHKKTVIGHSRILDPELRTPDAARLVARRLTIKAASRLRRTDLYASAFDLVVKTPSTYSAHGDINRGEAWQASIKLSPAQDNFAFLKSLDDMWAVMETQLKPNRLKKVAVTLHGLCERQQITPDLFDMSSEPYQNLQQRHQKLSNLIDGLNQKYGAETVQIGITPKTKAGYVGTKIAFHRIPDLAEFQE